MIDDDRMAALERLAGIYPTDVPVPELARSTDGRTHAVGRTAAVMSGPCGVEIHVDDEDPWKIVEQDELMYGDYDWQWSTIAIVDLDRWSQLIRTTNGWSWSALPE